MPGKNKVKETGKTLKRRKRALGKGLDALIPDIDDMEGISDSSPDGGKDFFQCDLHLITPNRYQPRLKFSDDQLEELAESIRAQGVIQPVVVRKADSGYELVAGERRLRAAKRVGMDRIPVIVKDISDARMLEMSIVENIQRSNLNPMEESRAYHRLIEEFDLTQEQAADRVGKSRSAVANFLRLRHLPGQIKNSIMEGEISMGHARALLGVEATAAQVAAWRQVVSKKLSVRETEALVKRLKAEKVVKPDPEPDPNAHYFADISDRLSKQFGTMVKIKRRGERGRVEIDFYSNDDLDRLLGLLNNTHL